MKHKILFFDIDGTITSEIDGSISESTKGAIKQLIQNGYHVVAATGRPLSMCHEIAVLKELKKSATVWNNYNKSVYTHTQKAFLKEHIGVAIDRAKALKEFQNPSSNIYKLVEILKDKL